jgi:aminopeptidase YwaD
MRRRIRQLAGVAAAGLAAWSLCWAPSAWAGSSLEQRLRAHVVRLTAPKMQGRGNATEGLEGARDYIAAKMEEIGLEPAGTQGYLSPLEAVTRAAASRSSQLQIGDNVLAEAVEFRPASYSDSGRFSAEAVFVGYGLTDHSIGYDDYAGVDVRDKTVIALTGVPAEHEQSFTPSHRAYLATSWSKAAVAQAQGARAILFVNDPRGHGQRSDQRPDALASVRPVEALEGIAAGHVSRRACERVLANLDIDLEQLQQQIDRSGQPHSRSLGVEVSGELAIDRQRTTIYNVVGRLPGADNGASPVVMTAHYDGLGLGYGASLSEAVPSVHPGADDNASGVALLLESARSLVANPPANGRPIIFAAPAGEELGLRGSRRLARQVLDRHDAGLVVNLDMVGRLRDETLYVARNGGDEAVAQRLRRSAQSAGLQVQSEALQERFSDHISFVELGFGGMSITTGRHADYHVPGDTIDKIDWSGLVRVTMFINDLVRSLAADRS